MKLEEIFREINFGLLKMSEIVKMTDSGALNFDFWVFGTLFRYESNQDLNSAIPNCQNYSFGKYKIGKKHFHVKSM